MSLNPLQSGSDRLSGLLDNHLPTTFMQILLGYGFASNGAWGLTPEYHLASKYSLTHQFLSTL